MSQPPVTFVYGALRSGTTLFRLMIDAHPQLANPGEADFLFDHLEQTDQGIWRYEREALETNRIFQRYDLPLPGPETDGVAHLREMIRVFGERAREKGGGHLTLNIHRHVDRVVELLPEAKVIHLLRDPRDVANSCIGMGWAGTSYHGVRMWIDTEQAWDRAGLPPDRVLELRYENLMRTPEPTLGRVCEFLGVSYDPVMLSYPETSTYGPPDARLTEQWRRKTTPEMLGLVEHRVGSLLEARGYAPSGAPQRAPGPLEAARLWLTNKAYFWRFAARRYGLGLVLSEKISRWLGLTSLNRRARLKLNEKAKAYLK